MAMDLDSQTAVRLLETLALVDRILRDYHFVLVRRGIKEVSHALECRSYDNGGTMLTGYVDAELAEGAVAWLLHVTWDDKAWLITTSVEMNRNGGDSGDANLKQFPERQIASFDEFLRHIVESTYELVAFTEPLE